MKEDLRYQSFDIHAMSTGIVHSSAPSCRLDPEAFLHSRELKLMYLNENAKGITAH